MFVEGFRGWGRGLRRAVANWYNALPAEQLAFQAVKYQQRDGWSHRDALRLAHPQAASEGHDQVFHWLTQGWPGVGDEPHPDPALRLIWAFERAKRAASEAEMVGLIEQYNLPWEAIPTQWLASPRIWQALLPRLPMTAMLRNLGRMTANGVLAPLNEATRLVVERLADDRRLRAARSHPIAVLAALKSYSQGRGERGKLTWPPVVEIVEALDRAFYLAFGNVEATGKRWLLGLDVSGSMAGTLVNGIPGMEARVACGAMALVTAAVEPLHTFVAFDTQPYPLAISPRQRLDDVVRLLAQTGGGGTDCAQPILWAIEQRVAVDAFVILTDSQTWYGQQHPAQALQEYRRKLNRPAKLVVVAMAANRWSAGEAEDAGLLNVVGFDLATSQLIADFVR
jgi:60 kDa SS-A/Ro ribonucleoprotein